MTAIAGDPGPARTHRELTAALLGEAYDGRPSLLGSALADVLARLALQAADGTSGESRLVDWLERTTRRAPLDARAVRMLEHAHLSLAPLLGGSETIDSLPAKIERTVRLALALRSAEFGTAGGLADELDSTIAAFVVKLDDVDAISAEHSRAVSLWCRRLASHMNFSGEQIRFAARCGLLHDVGKARTPKDILLSPRALTDQEWAIMRDHTIAGARMLMEVERLAPFIPAARSHHERLDGKGYPDRLSAIEISPIVRIVSVADSFNAMIGRRPYRLPLSPAHALEQLVRHRGTQFDPDVVEAMIAIVDGDERPA